MSRIDRNLLVVEPYRRIRPTGELPFPVDYGMGSIVTEVEGGYSPTYDLVPRSEFLRELYPSGHKINSPLYYPDEYKQVEIKYQAEDGTTKTRQQWVKQKVDRVAVPFQYIIKTQHNIHLCGNNIMFRDSNHNPSDADKDILVEFKQLWLDRNMESHFYACVDSEHSTGDCLIVFYFDARKKIRARTYSYLDGYTICRPVYDPLTGEPLAQAMKYFSYDEKDKAVCEYVDVWDTRKFMRLKRSYKGIGALYGSVMESLGLQGYTVDIKPTEHGFPFLPLAYKRNRIGPAWSNSQHLCDTYDLGLSQACRNNRTLSTAIVFLAGGDADVKGMADGRPYAIVSNDSSAKAEILTYNDTSTAFDSTLKTIKDNIFLGSFTVMPPEVRSGDLPGIAIKLIYSPSLDKAMDEAKAWDSFVDRMTMCFKYGMGVETGRVSDMDRRRITGTTAPYAHENTTELISNICQAKLAGIMSVETASNRNPYSANDEFNMIRKEQRDERELEEQETSGMIRITENNNKNQ